MTDASVATHGINYGEEARAEIHRGIDGVPVHAAEAYADRDDDQTDQQGREVRSRRQ